MLSRIFTGAILSLAVLALSQAATNVVGADGGAANLRPATPADADTVGCDLRAAHPPQPDDEAPPDVDAYVECLRRAPGVAELPAP